MLVEAFVKCGKTTGKKKQESSVILPSKHALLMPDIYFFSSQPFFLLLHILTACSLIHYLLIISMHIAMVLCVCFKIGSRVA